MTAPASAALLEALALLRSPRSRRPGPGQRLPDGVLQLLRIAAGEDEATTSAEAATRESAATLREAAIFYIQQVCFAPGSNSYRVLGVDPDASDERLREHYRWLARWLHPDRNPDQWEAVFAERVNSAWQDVRTSERRARYQPVVEEADDWSTLVAAPPAHAFHPPPEEALPEEPGRTRDLRWIPSAVVATLGSVAIGMIVLFYSSRHPQSEIEPVASGAEMMELPAKEAPPPAVAPAPVAVASDVVSAQPAVLEAAPAPALQPPPPAETAPRVEAAITRPAPSSVATAPIAAPRPPKQAAPEIAPTARPQAPRPVAVAVADVAPAPAASRGSAPVDPTPPPPESPKPSTRDANRMLGQFSQAYEDGDLQGMRALFAPDARGPTGDLNSILAEYRRVFADSSERSLAVRDVSWFVTGDTFTIVASFEAVVTSGRGARRTRGDLRLDLRREGDHWQIFRMQHGDRPG